ncbi:MAG TPA: helix-turn-helix transcriptional regulator [Thermoanaerobaculia bacterium]|nr:helix-turn-helix transcriptional regulator [Thermoanaerobaculia bacterium]
MSPRKKNSNQKGGRPPGVKVRGEIVRKTRLAKKLSKEKLARLADLNADTVGKAESGGPIAEVSLAKLAEALNLEFDDLRE